LVELGGTTLLSRALAVLDAARLSSVVVVLGAGAADVQSAVDLAGRTVVVNDAWPDGMGGSLRRGLTALEGQAEAAVITLVDQPFVTVGVIERLAAAWHGGAVAAVATYAGRRANPAVLDASIWADVASWAVGDVGARGWFSDHPDLVTPVECDDAGAADDIDTPADLARVRTQLQARF
jgi:nicotine blue oxidoreductase